MINKEGNMRLETIFYLHYLTHLFIHSALSASEIRQQRGIFKDRNGGRQDGSNADLGFVPTWHEECQWDI